MLTARPAEVDDKRLGAMFAIISRPGEGGGSTDRQESKYSSSETIHMKQVSASSSHRAHRTGAFRNKSSRRRCLSEQVLQALCALAQRGGKGRPIVASKSSAAAALSEAFLAKLSRAALTDFGGPRSKRFLGGGRRRSMSPMQVALENITYRWSHHSASSKPRCPVGSRRSP